jgi:hypothetical protein
MTCVDYFTFAANSGQGNTPQDTSRPASGRLRLSSIRTGSSGPIRLSAVSYYAIVFPS